MPDSEFKQGEEHGLLQGDIRSIKETVARIEQNFLKFSENTGKRMQEGEERMGDHDTAIALIQKNIGETNISTISKTVGDLSDAKKWVVTSILGAVFLAIIGLVIKK